MRSWVVAAVDSSQLPWLDGIVMLADSTLFPMIPLIE